MIAAPSTRTNFLILLSTLLSDGLFRTTQMVYAGLNLVPFVESPNETTLNFKSTDCAIKENSLGNEVSPLPTSFKTISRNLLRFTVGIKNEGPDDLYVSRTDNPDWYVWGDCHHHWHFVNFTNYRLLDKAGVNVVSGRKQAFCLMDIRQMDSTAGPRQYSCSNQGITKGWADIYSYTLDGQWIDIEGVCGGEYTLEVEVNYGRRILETNYEDNKLSLPVVIRGSPNPNCEGGGGGPGTGCNAEGNTCDGASATGNCCSEVCVKGFCVCAPPGDACGADHNCCSGKCNRFTCRG